MEYNLPNKEVLFNEFLKKYGDEFLRLNGLKIGDIVNLRFSYNILRSKYKSRQMERFTEYKKADGILKYDDNGALIAESLDDFDFYYSVSNGRSGRDYKSWYELKRGKSVYKFGIGFIL